MSYLRCRNDWISHLKQGYYSSVRPSIQKTMRCNMVPQPLRSFTYLILLFVIFTLKSRSSFLPNTSSNIEPALTGATLSIASGSPSPNTPFECYPITSRSRGPFLDKDDCRQAVSVFYRRFPKVTSGGAHILRSLTHSTRGNPVFRLNVLMYSHILVVS